MTCVPVPEQSRRQIRAGGHTFDLIETGAATAPAVLLLHGFPQTSLSFSAVAGRLAAAGLRCLAPDQRGYSPGARPVGVASYTAAHLVGDVLGMLDALRLDAVDLVGHDWGAAVAWQLAARHPDRIRSLTAVSVPHPTAFTAALRTDEDQRTRSAYMRFFRVPDKPEEVLLRDGGARLRAMYGTAVPAADQDTYVAALSEPGALTAALNWYRAASAADQDGLGPVTVPTTYVWSTADPAIGRVGAQACGEQVTGPYRFVVLDGISHWIPDEAPDRLAAQVLARVAR